MTKLTFGMSATLFGRLSIPHLCICWVAKRNFILSNRVASIGGYFEFCQRSCGWFSTSTYCYKNYRNKKLFHFA